MNQKDFNLLLADVSNGIKPINQLLFECLVLIIFYYIFNSLSNNNTNTNNNNTKWSKKPEFIYLICLIFILLDWFIWNNYIQTSLFTAILIVYILYNINKSRTLSTFVNIINDSRDINKINNKIETQIKNNDLEEEYEKAKQQDQLNMITFIPKEIDFSNPKNNPNYTPDPYEKKLDNINELNSAYSSGIPSIHITDSQFAELQLNNLYDTPQYKNIKAKLSDKSLYNYNEKSDKEPTLSSYFTIDKNENKDQNIIFLDGVSQDTNLDLFKKPKRVFLDSKWLDLKENTYNDNCKNCKGANANANKKYTKNAICSVVKYGQELEECTNQSNSVNNDQLLKISTNKLDPIYRM